MRFEEYSGRDGIGLAELVRRGEVSPREVEAAANAAIDALNPRLNAVVVRNGEPHRGRDEAFEGPLRGVPFLLKDVNLYSEDMPTRFASRFFDGARPRSDSTMVARWRKAGLMILGKTNTPEFAQDFITEPHLWGTAVNPWNAGVTVGGSSGGAAVAVASGMVPVAHGTDLGGSIRIPAACCGVFGFKPSVGLNPLGPHCEEIAGGLDSDHVLTRSVRDSAASLDATAGPDTGARAVVTPRPGGYLAAIEEPFDRLRVGLCTVDPYGNPAGANQVAAAERTAEILRGLGHAVEPWRFPQEAEAGPWFDTLWSVDVLRLVRERAAELGRPPRDDEIEPLTRAALALAEGLTADDYLLAKREMKRTAVAIMRAMEGFDIILTPALAEDPPALGALNFEANGGTLDGWNARGLAFAAFSAPANLTGQPAASCPVGVTPGGLPVGVQLAGRPGDDTTVLRLAREIERTGEWTRGVLPAGA